MRGLPLDDCFFTQRLFEQFDKAVAAWPAVVLADAGLIADVERFVGLLRPAGWVNALGQKLVQLTMPGVPDLYQGSELWDLSLVDPDNRRPVDFSLRRRLLDELRESLLDKPSLARQLYEQWPDGRIKMFVPQAGLLARRAQRAAPDQ